MKKLNRNALFLWRIRLTACVAPLPLAVALFFGSSPVWNLTLTLLWVLFYLFMFLFYYPVKHVKLLFGVNGHAFIVYCGVFYNRIKAMELKNVQFVTICASPLERVMKLSTLFVWGAGGKIRVPSMPSEDAERLSAALSRTGDGERQ